MLTSLSPPLLSRRTPEQEEEAMMQEAIRLSMMDVGNSQNQGGSGQDGGSGSEPNNSRGGSDSNPPAPDLD